MADSTTIHAFPELRQLAEREARAFNNASGTWTEQGLNREAIPAMLALLCDLSRDASQDAVARLVATALGDEWSSLRVRVAVELRQRNWSDLCDVACVPESQRDVQGAAEALATVVRHLWPEPVVVRSPANE